MAKELPFDVDRLLDTAFAVSAPFYEVQEIHAKGPQRWERGAPSQKRKLCGRKVENLVEIAEKAPTIGSSANACRSQVGLPQNVEPSARVQILVDIGWRPGGLAALPHPRGRASEGGSFLV